MRDGTHGDTFCGHQVREVTHVEALGRAGTDKPEERVGKPRHRKITDDSAGGIEHRRKDRAPDPLRQAACQNAIQESFGSGTFDLVPGEAGYLDHADRGTQRPAFPAHRPEPVGPAESRNVSSFLMRPGKPQRTLETVGRTENRAFLFQQIIDRRCLERPACLPFLVGISDGKSLAIGFGGTRQHIGLRGPVTEPGNVKRHHVHRWHALEDPFGECPAHACALGKARDHAGCDEMAGHARNGADQGGAVWRPHHRAVDDPLDSGGPEAGHDTDRSFHVDGNAVDVVGKQFHAEIGRSPVDRPVDALALVASPAATSSMPT